MSQEAYMPLIVTWTEDWASIQARAWAMASRLTEAWLLSAPAAPVGPSRLERLEGVLKDLPKEDVIVPAPYGHLFNAAIELRWRRLTPSRYRLVLLTEVERARDAEVLPLEVTDGVRAGQGWTVEKPGWDKKGSGDTEESAVFLYGAFLPHLGQFLEVGAPGALGGLSSLGRQGLPVRGAVRRLTKRLYLEEGMVRQVRLTGVRVDAPWV